MIVLVIGGVRSGKSRHGEMLGLGMAAAGAPLFYIATARTDAGDAEMAARIARHQAKRHKRFTTIEIDASPSLNATINNLPPASVFVVDGLGLWLANCLDNKRDWQAPIADTLAAIKTHKHTAVFISDEVGSGIVPPNALARQFTDGLGEINQQLAAEADQVIHMVAGIACVIKGK